MIVIVDDVGDPDRLMLDLDLGTSIWMPRSFGGSGARALTIRPSIFITRNYLTDNTYLWGCRLGLYGFFIM